MNVEQVIRDYLPDILHLSLSTCVNNKPWTCEVHFAYDDDLNLYFSSQPHRRHSLEITENPYVSGTIVTQHDITEKPRGIYFEGTAELLTDIDESHPGYQAYVKRLNRPNTSIQELYKITVTDYYVFDVRESKPPHKYHLPR